MPRPPADVETRRGLPVKRPKGMPFSYTVERNRGSLRMAVHFDVDGYGPLTGALGIAAYGNGSAHVFFSNAQQPRHEDGLEALGNFAAALRWAVRYARKWNKKHGFGDASDAQC